MRYLMIRPVLPAMTAFKSLIINLGDKYSQNVKGRHSDTISARSLAVSLGDLQEGIKVDFTPSSCDVIVGSQVDLSAFYSGFNAVISSFSSWSLLGTSRGACEPGNAYVLKDLSPPVAGLKSTYF